MKKTALLLLTIIASFSLGFALKGFLENKDNARSKKVTGIGGIFFKCKESKKARAWYRAHLGFNVNDYGAVFEWRQGADEQTARRKSLPNGAPFQRKQNTPLRRTL